MEQARNFVKVLIGSATLALFLTLLGIALGLYGIIDVGMARFFLLVGWASIVLGVLVSDYLCGKSRTHIAFVTISVAIAAGLCLFYVDRYAIRKRAEQDALNQPPPKIATIAPSPTVPIVKTPKPKRPKPNNVGVQQTSTGSNSPNTNVGTVNQNGQGNVSQVGGGPLQSCPNGICIGTENKGTAVVINNGPPQRTLTKEQEDKLETFAKAIPESYVLGVHSVSDPEAIKFAGTIRFAVTTDQRGALWEQNLFAKPNEPRGVFVQSHPGQEEAVKQLCAGLRLVKLEVDCYEAKDIPENTIWIYVGVAP